MLKLIVFALYCIFQLHITSSSTMKLPNILGRTVESKSTNEVEEVDSSFYSRQLLVYGESAQIRLSKAHVVILSFNNLLSTEVVKNLALGGVGQITIVDRLKETFGNSPLLGKSLSLTDYARSLNPYVKVGYYTYLNYFLYFYYFLFIFKYKIIGSRTLYSRRNRETISSYNIRR
jgi:hypothetical protein